MKIKAKIVKFIFSGENENTWDNIELQGRIIGKNRILVAEFKVKGRADKKSGKFIKSSKKFDDLKCNSPNVNHLWELIEEEVNQKAQEFVENIKTITCPEIGFKNENVSIVSPVIQPLLTLGFEDDDNWMIDVGGNIQRFIKGGKVTVEEKNRIDESTELLKEILDSFKKQGKIVRHVGTYHGSAGPGYIYRGNVFFKRMGNFHVKPKKDGTISVFIN